jgi:uncharacterized protein YjdB
MFFRLFLCATFIFAIYAFKSEYGRSEFAVAEAAAKPTTTVTKKTLTVGEKYTIKLKDQSSKAVVTYKSSDSKIATVSNKGVINSVAKGSATITVTIKQGGKTYTSKIAVTVKAEKLYDKFIKTGKDFNSYVKGQKLDISKVEDILKKIYAYEYLVNVNYLDTSVRDKLVKNKIIDINSLADDASEFTSFFTGCARGYYNEKIILDLSKLSFNSEDKKSCKHFIDTLTAISEGVDLKEGLDLREILFYFIDAGNNNLRTNFPVMFDEMSESEKVIFITYFNAMLRFVDANRYDLISNAYDYTPYSYSKILSDENPVITPKTRVLWIGGESYPIEIRNLKAGASVSYKSGDSKVATVTKDGIVKAVSEGTVKITATIKQDKKSYTSVINIEVRCADVLITNEEPVNLNVGEIVLLKANNGFRTSNYEWSSSDPKLMKIDNKTGEATALSTGNVAITVKNKDDNTKDTINLTIYESDLDIARLYGMYSLERVVPVVWNRHHDWIVKIDENGITYANNSISEVWSNPNKQLKYKVTDAELCEIIDGFNYIEVTKITLDTSVGELALIFYEGDKLRIDPSPEIDINWYEANRYKRYWLERKSLEDFTKINKELKKDWAKYDENELKFYGTWWGQGDNNDYMDIQYNTKGGGGDSYIGYNAYNKWTVYKSNPNSNVNMRTAGYKENKFNIKFDEKYQTIYVYFESEKDWKFKLKYELKQKDDYSIPQLVGVDSEGNKVVFELGFG